WMAADALTVCGFLIRPLHDVFGWDNFGADFLNATTGWEVTPQEWKDMVQRLQLMERCNCIREGYIPERDDMIPDRFFEETIYSKYGKPKILNREEFLEFRKKTYLSYELNPQGIPSRESLERLDMDFVIPEMEKRLGRW
ncbi:MAG: aldehyde ferredoxin oxidoreductase C-terminal domain-containing protein, partial [Deltaproteobacteria bacterium]|nr:aldehyde ferredoxin oxidoreductase C-terminal domain-containing protein [Deltaproteobacteria bacterium]